SAEKTSLSSDKNQQNLREQMGWPLASSWRFTLSVAKNSSGGTGSRDQTDFISIWTSFDQISAPQKVMSSAQTGSAIDNQLKH
ncbi:hypothetical protein GOODEAATRI_024408, partial [Goodea atripinnis]